MSLSMHGQTGTTVDGKPVFGAFTQEQIKIWILEKLGEYKLGKNMPRASAAGTCATKFQDNKGKATPVTFDGLPVKHRSSGKKTDPDSKKCTIFYVARDGNVGRIIAIGHHRTSTSYDILWKSPGFLIGSSISLTDEEE